MSPRVFVVSAGAVTFHLAPASGKQALPSAVAAVLGFMLVKNVLEEFIFRGYATRTAQGLGLPGVWPHLLVGAVWAAWHLPQCTPDLLPSDVTGVQLWDASSREFVFHEGPVLANILLADEINRSPAKTQAALLEVMQERQVTVDAVPYAVPRPFLMMATQNPIEHSGRTDVDALLRTLPGWTAPSPARSPRCATPSHLPWTKPARSSTRPCRRHRIPRLTLDRLLGPGHAAATPRLLLVHGADPRSRLDAAAARRIKAGRPSDLGAEHHGGAAPAHAAAIPWLEVHVPDGTTGPAEWARAFGTRPAAARR